MDSLDSTSGKIVFKKRNHRPWNWKPASSQSIQVPEEAPIHSLLLTESPITQPGLEYGTPPLTTLENRLENSLQAKDQLETTLQSTDDNRLLLGGFLHPKHIIFFNDSEQAKKTQVLMSNLKEKEREILQLEAEIKITEAQEQLKNSEASKNAEANGRKLAEERAQLALQHLHQNAEKIRKLEAQILYEKQAQSETSKIKMELEQKLKVINQTIGIHEQARLRAENLKNEAEEKARMALELAQNAEKIANENAAQKILQTEELARENIRQLETSSQKKIREAEAFAEETARNLEMLAQNKIQEAENLIQEKIQHLDALTQNKIQEAQTKSQTLQFQADKKIQKIQEQLNLAEKAKSATQIQLNRTTDNLRVVEHAKQVLETKLEELTKADHEFRLNAEEKINSLLTTNSEIENIKSELLQEKFQTDKKLSESLDRIQKMNKIIQSEQALRKNSEDKLNFSIEKNQLLEGQKNLLSDELTETHQKIKELIMAIETER